MWRPYRKKDIDTLERIQRRATKIIPELRYLNYEERLKECGLTILETRWLRGHQIEVFKILNGYEIIDRNMFSSLKKDKVIWLEHTGNGEFILCYILAGQL